MKKVRYTGDSVSGILLTTNQGYSQDMQFNPGIIRNIVDEDAEKLGVKYPDIFEVYEPEGGKSKVTKVTKDGGRKRGAKKTEGE